MINLEVFTNYETLLEAIKDKRKDMMEALMEYGPEHEIPIREIRLLDALIETYNQSASPKLLKYEFMRNVDPSIYSFYEKSRSLGSAG